MVVFLLCNKSQVFALPCVTNHANTWTTEVTPATQVNLEGAKKDTRKNQRKSRK